MCHSQVHNQMTPVRLEPAAPQSQVKHSTTKSLRSHVHFELTNLDITLCH